MLIEATSQRVQIRVAGIVQGVGFRPFVYRQATAHSLSGWTLNDNQGVLIEVEGAGKDITNFITALRREPPPLANILSLDATPILPLCREGEGFHIRASDHTGDNLALLPTDSHVCDDCLKEFNNPLDRRFHYPFINCTNCGPRYSLIESMPYDRPQTTMRAFAMCEECTQEYNDPANRRYHAQPNACGVCGPYVTLRNKFGVISEREQAVTQAITALAAGEIVAVKSVGGFHLVVDARNEEAILKLRRRKKRDSKPFALMASSLELIEQMALVSAHERDLLASPGRPIVLLRKRETSTSPVASEAIAPRNPSIGIMLPSAPLHYLLLADLRTSILVMTSGNISGLPIAYRNEDAKAQLFDVCDLILEHNREIFTRIDDTVVRSTSHPQLERPLLSYLRKARGYAPYSVVTQGIAEPLVAYGAELKTTVALANGGCIHVSQHIGDLGNDETFRAHREAEQHLSKLYNVQPTLAACDLHPDFRSSRLAQSSHAGRTHAIQHHHAHMASCMVDNNLTGEVIGVVYDGSGFGVDRTIWGGEFLIGGLAHVERAGHLRPILLLGGDAAVREPIRCGIALALDAFSGDFDATACTPSLASISDDRRRVFARMWERRLNTTPASSMGRLFDGVSALLGVCEVSEYEAQGPIELEGLLGRDLTMAKPYRLPLVDVDNGIQLDHRDLVRELFIDVTRGVSKAEISRKFHAGIVTATAETCVYLRAKHSLDRVVLSGGVFLNEFLLANCLIELRRRGFDAYCHRDVPTNDGGVSVGQIAVANARRAAEADKSTVFNRLTWDNIL